MYDLSGDFEIGDGSDGDDVLGEILGELMGDTDGDGSDGDAILSGDDVLGALLGNGADGDAILSGLRNPFRRRKNRQKAALAKLLMNKKATDGKLLKKLRPSKWRRYPLGFVQLAVAASGTVNVTATPQVTFKGQRLTIPATVAINFVINTMLVGKDNQFAGSGAVPATTFAEVAVGEDLNLDTAQIGNTIVLNVTNIDTVAAHDFRATLLGDAVMQASC